MKLKDVTEEYLADLYDCDSDRIVEDYISFLRKLKARLSNCTLSYADQMQLKADLQDMEI